MKLSTVTILSPSVQRCSGESQLPQRYIAMWNKKLSFGLDQSFRTDAIGYLFENACFLQQDKKKHAGNDDRKTGSHLHFEIFGRLMKSWRELLDNHSTVNAKIYNKWWPRSIKFWFVYKFCVVYKSSPKVSFDFTFIFLFEQWV